jgi:predicted RNA binding protein YcfA (HicA-like mRNA interferase family)
MPRIPRDLSGRDLCKILSVFGYSVIRQVGSHIRLQCNKMGYDHSITIPDHESIKIGTLNKILSDVCAYLNLRKEDLLSKN